MSRNGSGVYSLPAGTEAVPGQTIDSGDWNAVTEDLANDNNTERPVAYGGTGASNAADARINLDAQQLDEDLTAIAALGFSARSSMVKTAANTWALVPQTTFGDSVLALADAAAGRTLFGLGTAALATIGTSGDTVPKNNTANLWGAEQTYSVGLTLNNNIVVKGKESGGTARELVQMNTSNAIQVGDANNPLALKGSAITYNNVAVPTISSSDTLSNKTLSSPTLSGTVAGTATFSGSVTGPVIVVSAASGSAPRFMHAVTDGGSNQKYWWNYAQDGVLYFTTLNDAQNSTTAWLTITRSGQTPTLAQFGAPLQAPVAVSSETSGTLTSASSNKQVNMTGDCTINDGVHAAGDRIELYAGASARSLIQDTGMTLRLDGSSTTGTRSVAARGRLAVYFVSNSEAIVSGMGVS